MVGGGIAGRRWQSMNNVWRFFVCVMCVGSSDTHHAHKHNTRITKITLNPKPETRNLEAAKQKNKTKKTLNITHMKPGDRDGETKSSSSQKKKIKW